MIISFTVDNLSSQIAAPAVTSIQLCSPGEATLRVNGLATASSYALYDSEEASFPLDVSVNVVFKVDAKEDKNYFVAQRIGNCESSTVGVKVKVGLSGLTIANSITPNTMV